MQFVNFPTPYPDEVFYSILCRYHIRSCNPGATTTRTEIWGYKESGKSLYLPSNLKKLTDMLPMGSGITVDKLIYEHTMYPYVKPVLPKERANKLYRILSGIDEHAGQVYATAGLAGRRLRTPRYLRYCPMCVQNDINLFGEAYWHRIHQLPGVHICPIHNAYIHDSKCSVHMIFRQFIPLNKDVYNDNFNGQLLSEEINKHLLAFAQDSMWMLQNGANIGTLEDTQLKYKEVLTVKGYRWISENSPINCEKLCEDLKQYYGEDFLGFLNADLKELHHMWPAQFVYKTINPPASNFLLMMRFLCGSPSEYMNFNKKYLPFGKGAWPCRNPICEYNLKDCIENIEIKIKSGQPKAIFTCPHCGYSYRRGKATPKELQYKGQVSIVDFGWLWREKLKKYLGEEKISVHRTAKLLKVCEDTILIHGIKLGLLPVERMPSQRIYKAQDKKKESDFEKTIEKYRQEWMELIKSNPDAKRSVLNRKNQKAYKFLMEYDKVWYENHVPERKSAQKNWDERDDFYYDKVVKAVENLLSLEGRPKRISWSLVAMQVGLGNSTYILKEKLSKTGAYLSTVVETKTEWRKRKIVWAVNKLHLEGITPSPYKVMIKSGISSTAFSTLRSFAEEEIRKITE